MNKKILLTTLIGMSYAPETNISDLPSTYPMTALLMRESKKYVKKAKNVKAMEMATARSYEDTIPGQRHVFDFLNDFFTYHLSISSPSLSKSEHLKYLAELDAKIKANAERINREFHTGSDAILYNDLSEAVKRKFPDIEDLYLTVNPKDAFQELAKLIPYMPLALLQAINSVENETYFNIEQLQDVLSLTIKPSDESDNPTMNKEAVNILREILKDELRKNKQYHFTPDRINYIKVALELEDIELANTIMDQLFNKSPQNIDDCIEIFTQIYSINNTELSNRAFEKVLSLISNFQNCFILLEEVKKIGNMELINRVLDTMLGWARDKYNYEQLLEEAKKIGNMELINRALEGLLGLARNSYDYETLMQKAKELNNTAIVTKILEIKLSYATAQHQYDRVISEAQEIGNMEFINKALKQLMDSEKTILNYGIVCIKATKVGSAEMANVALEKLIESAEKESDYHTLLQVAKEIKSTKLENIALGKLIEYAESKADLHFIFLDAKEIGNIEMANKALEKMLKLAKRELDYNSIIRMAKEIENKELEEQAKAKLEELESSKTE